MSNENIRDNIIAEGCCETCGPTESGLIYKDISENCKHNCCDTLPCNIDVKRRKLTSCLTIVEKIFGCADLESTTQFRNLNLPFIVTNGSFTEGDPVCITQIALGYECIGLKLDPAIPETYKGYINSKEVDFIAEDYSSPLCTCSGKYIYDKLKTTVPIAVYCCETNGDGKPLYGGVEVRVSEPDLDFYVCNLKIALKGKIGCPTGVNNDFEAEFTYSGPLSQLAKVTPPLGLKAVDFYGKICVPTNKKNIVLNEEFSVGNLATDCAVPTTNYHKISEIEYGFNADVLFCYFMKKHMYTTVKERLAVVYDSGYENECSGPINLCPEE